MPTIPLPLMPLFDVPGSIVLRHNLFADDGYLLKGASVKPTTRLIPIILFALVTVEFGGWSLLGMLTSQGSLTPFQEQFFRAGHAHAGVLLILTLVCLTLLERTAFTGVTQRWISLILIGGVLLQSGGFFLHLMLGREGAASAGTTVTRAGAVLLATALVSLGIGLLRAGPGVRVSGNVV